MTYAEYMESNEWYWKKKKALSRAGHKCQRCDRKNIELHVHHKKYPKVLGTEPSTWLEVLCINCHAEHHKEKLLANPDQAPRDLLDRVVPDVISDFSRRFAAFPPEKSNDNEKYRCKKCDRIHSPGFKCEDLIFKNSTGGMGKF